MEPEGKLSHQVCVDTTHTTHGELESLEMVGVVLVCVCCVFLRGSERLMRFSAFTCVFHGWKVTLCSSHSLTSVVLKKIYIFKTSIIAELTIFTRTTQ